MKVFLILFACVLSCGAIFIFKEKQEVNDDYFRIHVTANSNLERDEKIKYEVKDAVVDFLIPLLSATQTKQEAQKMVRENLQKICIVVQDVLMQNQVSYSAQVSISEEVVPLRVYGDLALDEGIYDCLKIELGEAKGENWWCVVFPAVCFVSSKNYQNVEYISKIWEIMNNVT